MPLSPEQLFLLGLLSPVLIKLINDWIIAYPVINHRNKKLGTTIEPVSVVICGRNEEENLLDFLPPVLEQNYPNFEVVFVNDRSIDDSQYVLRALENKYKHLKTATVKETELHWAGKKFALTIGLKAATYDHVVLTDADCIPANKNWLRSMVAQMDRYKKVVLGYGAYSRSKGLVNALIRTEALTIGQQYLGMAKLGIPYMGVGRNLAYDKTLFFDNKGFASHQFLPSGDDDLFINEVAHRKNTAICIDENSYTISRPEATFQKWIEQKRRHLTTSNRYNPLSTISLIYITLVRYLAYLSMIIVAFFPEGWQLALCAFSLNLTSLIGQHYRMCKQTHALDLLIWLPISEMFLLLFYPFLFIWNTILSGNPWRNY